MADGLLFVYTDPGPVPETEFTDWYDNEHVPARLAVPGFTSVARYRALDGLTPPWLATYEIVPGTLESPEYKALADTASVREKSIMSRLAGLERRVYGLVEEHYAAGRGPGSARRGGTAGGGTAGGGGDAAPVVMAVSMSVPAGTEDDVDAWYAQEHYPMLLAVPGWRRVRRYRLAAGTGPAYLSLHELDGQHVFDEDRYKDATSTPWRARILETAIGRERRVFGLHKAWS
ncbi:MAG TPA: hypothetical protein VG164_04340 [Trebonia sp.]|jgi:hypothetical protein|nr:hypothetical protein [Trebonia sp.]